MFSYAYDVTLHKAESKRESTRRNEQNSAISRHELNVYYTYK